MPELPEVETTRRGLATIMPGRIVREFIVHDARLRWPVPPSLPGELRGQRLLACERRGKYLLFRFARGTQIVHLGMSGSLRSQPADIPRRPHDHAEWVLEDGTRVLLHDPRRFGAILWHSAALGPVEDTHPLLRELGMEPFDPAFTGAILHAALAGRRQAIKAVLLGGKIVVGVGNIYACESLFLARIHPATPAGRLSRRRCERLVQAIRDTLGQALASGGSTLRDYLNASGEPGAYFQLHAAVYGREGEACPRCRAAIRRMVQGQRATYYCPQCQRW